MALKDKYTKVNEKFLKKEKWGNKNFIVARDEKGRLYSRRLLTKEFNQETAITKFKQDNSFTEGIRVNELTTVKEYFDYSKKPKLRSRYMFIMYQIEGYVMRGKNKIEVIARSNKEDVRNIPSLITKEELKEEARTSFLQRVAQALGISYEVKDGEDANELGLVGINREGFIHYEKIR